MLMPVASVFAVSQTLRIHLASLGVEKRASNSSRALSGMSVMQINKSLFYNRFVAQGSQGKRLGKQISVRYRVVMMLIKASPEIVLIFVSNTPHPVQ